MYWWYRFLEKTDNAYMYAYSCDSKALDGVIAYYPETEEAEVIKECAMYAGHKKAVDRAISHFFTVVREGFPEERHICCG